MKKLISLIAVALFAVATVNAAETMFFESAASGGFDVVIPAGAGAMNAQDVLLSVETNATVSVYVAKVSSTITNSASYTGTTLILNTDSSNTVSGVTIVTGDELIIGDQLRNISDIVVVEGGATTTITVASVTVTPGQAVYVCDGADVISLGARTTWANAPIPFLFRGSFKAPAAISIPSEAGAAMVSGRVVY